MGSPFAITDPLSAGKADRRSVARDRLRRTGSALYAAAALTQLAVLFAPDPDPSDHAGLAIVAAACALVALGLYLWRRPPLAVLHAISPLGIVITTAAVAVAKPVALTSMFYLLPLTLAAYFLDRRAVLANLALAAAGYALALTLFVEPVLRVASFAAVLSIVAVVSWVILALTERVGGLVQRLEDLAIYDPLTGALNRQPFNERLDIEMARVARSGGTCAVAMIDLDNFKGAQRRAGARGRRRGAGELRRAGPHRQAPRRPLRPRGRRGVHGDPRGHRRRLGRDLRRQPARAARRGRAAGHDQRRDRGHRGVRGVGRDADGRRGPRAVPRQALRARPRGARRAPRAAARRLA